MSSRYWKLGILGWPLGYSLSPLIHERALARAGLEGEYREYPVSPEGLWEWLSRVGELRLAGFNVTMPYKKSVFAWLVGEGRGRLGRLEALDRRIGAINTVVIDESGRPIGYNTDGEGFLRALVEPPRSLDLAGWHVLLLGAGGAAQAIAAVLGLKGRLRRLTLWSRRPAAARELVELVEGACVEGEVKPPAVEAVEELRQAPVEECQMVINATPVGMPGQSGPLLDPDRLRAGQWVYELVYQPRETPLVQRARQAGCRVVTGEEMLAGQAAASFELWTGVKGMLPVMRQALDEHFSAG